MAIIGSGTPLLFITLMMNGGGSCDPMYTDGN